MAPSRRTLKRKSKKIEEKKQQKTTCTMFFCGHTITSKRLVNRGGCNYSH